MLRLRTLDVSFRTAYAQAKELALAQARVPLLTAGSLHVEPRRGGRYVYRYRYGATGKRVVEYLGPEGAHETVARVEQARVEIAEHAALAAYALDLRRLGLYSADNATTATVASLFNAGIFGHGAVLVGTHAFGVLLNELGVLLSPFPMTEDIDVARSHPIEMAALPSEGFLGLLRETGLPFDGVPPLRRGAAPTSFRVRGATLKVDLLVPSDRKPFSTVRLPELKAHATALPYLGYLLESWSPSVLIGRERVVPIAVPHAGRFCIHKLAVHSLRAAGEEAKRQKDVLQAATLAAAIEGEREWLLAEAVGAASRTLRARIRPAARRASALISQHHPDAAARLAALA